MQKEVLEGALNCLTRDKATSYEQCVVWARLRFEEMFNNQIQQLLYNFPKDSVTSSGAPFWSGPKRAPDALVFNAEDVSCTILATTITYSYIDPESHYISASLLLPQICTLSTMD